MVAHVCFFLIRFISMLDLSTKRLKIGRRLTKWDDEKRMGIRANEMLYV